MEQLERKKNYIGKKFLLNDYKLNIKSILSKNGFLKTYSISSALKDVVTKEYYDTKDRFFKSSGINISINRYKSRNFADLVIRYDSPVKRIAFLSDIPDTFIKKIGKAEKVSSYFPYISTAIMELVPKGLNIDVFEFTRTISKILEVQKKRERVRVINNNGLKVIFSFEKDLYINSKNNKVKLDLLELRMENTVKDSKLFDNMVHELKLQEYKLIELNKSDLFIGEEYLDI